MLLFFSVQYLNAQQIIFSENFERKTLDSSWQKVNGNWYVADVQELKIAPAENGFQYVLCADSTGIINFFVDIPDSVRFTLIKLSFSYYTWAKGPSAIVEAEFHKKDLKDGLKGKLWKASLPVRGKWIRFQKILKIPAGANIVWIEFHKSPLKSSIIKNVCFDNVIVSMLK